MEVIVDELLNVKKYKKSRKRLNSALDYSSSSGLQDFIHFVQKRRKDRGSSGLSFALNLEDDDLKFAVVKKDISAKSLKRKQRVTKDEVPPKFMKHILSLGFQESDAPVLYESKDEWLGLHTGELETENLCCNWIISNSCTESKIRCSYKKCKFEPVTMLNCLVDHCRTVHKWHDAACDYEGCQFVAYNILSLRTHKTIFHSKHKQFVPRDYPCCWKGCLSSFKDSYLRDVHMRIHSNQLHGCSFCPYRTNEEAGLRDHYRVHYQIRNFKCEVCGHAFVNRGSLTQHVEEKHTLERVITCHICNGYTSTRKNVQKHLTRVHNLLSRWNDREKKLETFER